MYTKSGKVSRPKVHRLVLEAFVGPKPAGLQACHANGIRTDNRPCNLRWDTYAGNLADRDRHGSVKGERNGRAKLTAKDVADIRAAYVYGSSTHGTTALARQYGLHQTTVCDIVNGRRGRWQK